MREDSYQCIGKQNWRGKRQSLGADSVIFIIKLIYEIGCKKKHLLLKRKCKSFQQLCLIDVFVYCIVEFLRNDLCIDLSGSDTGVVQQFGNMLDSHSVVQCVGGEGVSRQVEG